MRAEMLLRQKGVQNIEKILLDENESKREEMISRTGRKTVPQIFIGETHVGGFDDLAKINKDGALDELLGLF